MRLPPCVLSLLLVSVALAGAARSGPPEESDPPEPGALARAARAAGVEVGAAVDYNLSEARLAVAAAEFTSATLENSLKWTPLSPAPGVYDFTNPDTAIDWAESEGLRIRGHTLFWDRLNGKPPWLEDEVAAADDPAARLTELMETHAATVIGRYAGRIAQWDVVNEPQGLVSAGHDPQNFFYQTLGESYLDIAFRAARAADPDAALFLNETLIVVDAKVDGLIAIAEGMLERGVPLDGLGLQGHFAAAPPDRALLEDQLHRIENLGLIAELTEVDIPLPLFEEEPDPLAAQAQAYADVFEACRAVPACTGITTWGIDDGKTWLDSFPLTMGNAPNRPLLFDESLAPKPAYAAAVQALPEPAAAASLVACLAGLAVLRRAHRPQPERAARVPAPRAQLGL